MVRRQIRGDTITHVHWSYSQTRPYLWLFSFMLDWWATYQSNKHPSPSEQSFGSELRLQVPAVRWADKSTPLCFQCSLGAVPAGSFPPVTVLLDQKDAMLDLQVQSRGPSEWSRTLAGTKGRNVQKNLWSLQFYLGNSYLWGSIHTHQYNFLRLSSCCKKALTSLENVKMLKK